jgi:hypothetical protein
VMEISTTADDQVSSFSPATCHQLLQLPGRWGFNVIVWKLSLSEPNLPRPPPLDVLIFTAGRSLGHWCINGSMRKPFLTKIQVVRC